MAATISSEEKKQRMEKSKGLDESSFCKITIFDSILFYHAFLRPKCICLCYGTNKNESKYPHSVPRWWNVQEQTKWEKPKGLHRAFYIYRFAPSSLP